MPDPSKDFERLLQPFLVRLSLQLSSEQRRSLSRHYGLLQRWNRHVNLTSIRSPEQIVERHFGEALHLATLVREAKSLVDVGSGAGFPGLPFAVARPDVDVTLVESVSKKVAFLKEVSRPLGNVSVYHGRVEDLGESFDWSTTRAVALRDVLPQLTRIAAKVALLVSREEVADLKSEPSVIWEGSSDVPWNEHSVVLIGRTAS